MYIISCTNMNEKNLDMDSLILSGTVYLHISTFCKNDVSWFIPVKRDIYTVITQL